MVQPGTSGTEHSTLTFGMNYGGVVTVASSLQGAKILNNRPLILQMANDACSKVGSALIQKKLPSILSFLNSNLNVLIDGACKFAANTALPMFFNDYYKGITESYKVGANDIKTLNQDTNNNNYCNFPKMAFYAVEPQENIFWRTMRWMAGSKPNDSSAFRANDDWHLFNKTIRPKIDTFQAEKESNYAEWQRCLTIALSTWWIPITGVITGPIYLTRAKDHHDKYLAFDKGLEWFNYANENWLSIIGAKTIRVDTILKIPLLGMNITYEVKEDNDGVVLAESAANLPKATHRPVKIYPNENSPVDINKGSSHMQVRNDEGIRIALKDLFDGKHDPWFWTAPQP